MVGAVDNIDHDPSSIFAWYSISITQFPAAGDGLMMLIVVGYPFG